MTIIETTTYHALRSWLLRELGEDLHSEQADAMAARGCWIPNTCGISEALTADDEPDLAELWDTLSAEEQSAMLREAARAY